MPTVKVAVRSPSGSVERRPTPASEALDDRVADLPQLVEGHGADAEGGQALLGVAAVGLDVQGGQRLDRGAPGVVEVPECDEVVGQGSGLVGGPGMEGGDELVLPDQAVLQGEQPEEEMAVGRHAGAPIGGQPGRHPGASAPEPIVGTLRFSIA